MTSAGRSAVPPALRPAVTWLGAAGLGWFAVLLVEVSLTGGAGLSSFAAAGYLAELALTYAILASVPVAAVHGLALGLRRRGVAGVMWPVVAVGLLAVYPAWRQADLLTSGDRIAAHALQPWVRGALFVACVAAWQVLWLWHLRLVSATPAQGAARRLLFWMAGLGVGAAVVLAYAIERRLDNYQFFARFLVPACWLVVATLLFRACRGRWTMAGLVFILVAAIAASSRLAPDEAATARMVFLSRYRLVAATDRVVSPPSGEAAPFRFDVSRAEEFDCRRRPLAQAWPPLALDDAQRRNVILVSVDALRRDAPDFALAGKPLMPALRAFRARSVAFDRAVTTYPATIFSLAGALTGLAPSELLFSAAVPANVFRQTRGLFDQQLISLPASEWFGMPAIDSLVIQDTPVSFGADAAEQTSAFVDRLRAARSGGARTFAWIHYFEPHAEYVSHPGFEFGDSPRARYQSELAYLDSQLGQLFGYLEGDGWFDDALIVFFSDHGQALGERGYYGHHVYLNSWIHDVALYVRVPGGGGGATEAVADLRDVAATIRHYLGLPPGAADGAQSLLAATRGRGKDFAIGEAFPIRGQMLFSLANRPIRHPRELEQRLTRVQRAAEAYIPKVALVTAEHRLIVHRDTGVYQLYDRVRDPRERANLAASEPELARDLLERLETWHRGQSERFYCDVVGDPRGRAAADADEEPAPAARE